MNEPEARGESRVRRILIAAADAADFLTLNAVLKGEFAVFHAPDEQKVKEAITENPNLSLVIAVPSEKIPAEEIIKWSQSEPETAEIPFVIATQEKCKSRWIKLGATEVLSKPYPDAARIRTRIRNAIRLAESRKLIHSTERDSLTGLYNQEFFFRYIEQFDLFNPDTPKDAIVIDINHFHMINERYGNRYGDEILKRIGKRIKEQARNLGGFACHTVADTFFLYSPHHADYTGTYNAIAESLESRDGGPSHLRLRMGVYEHANKTKEAQRRFDRAKLVADTLKTDYTRKIAIYDKTMHEQEVLEEKLLEDFDTALEEEQFNVYYQPKFNIRSEIPVLDSAEALVRWMHPKLGTISPGVFVPLFEKHGLIEKLDIYVWEHAAAQIEHWRKRFGLVLSVSVNVSRIDLYDPKLISILQDILDRHGLQPSELLLEITEAAYTTNSSQIIKRVGQLRDLGFQIEMDDFGSGYSSLNMISTLPIDALKLDMRFVRNAFHGNHGLRLLEWVIDIAECLSVPMIAEGVETEEQLNMLRAMGCDIVQGYYFSKPVSAEEYEHFITDELEREKTDGEEGTFEQILMGRDWSEHPENDPVLSLAIGFERIIYVDVSTGRYIEFTPDGYEDDLQMKKNGDDFFEAVQKWIADGVIDEDREKMSKALHRERILHHLSNNPSFSIFYHMIRDGKPVYCGLKAVPAEMQGAHYIVIAFNNVDAAIQRHTENKIP